MFGDLLIYILAGYGAGHLAWNLLRRAGGSSTRDRVAGRRPVVAGRPGHEGFHAHGDGLNWVGPNELGDCERFVPAIRGPGWRDEWGTQ